MNEAVKELIAQDRFGMTVLVFALLLGALFVILGISLAGLCSSLRSRRRPP
jgi:hypothetical protein